MASFRMLFHESLMMWWRHHWLLMSTWQLMQPVKVSLASADNRLNSDDAKCPDTRSCWTEIVRLAHSNMFTYLDVIFKLTYTCCHLFWMLFIVMLPETEMLVCNATAQVCNGDSLVATVTASFTHTVCSVEIICLNNIRGSFGCQSEISTSDR